MGFRQGSTLRPKYGAALLDRFSNASPKSSSTSDIQTKRSRWQLPRSTPCRCLGRSLYPQWLPPPGSTTALPLCSVAGPPLATSRHWTSVVSVVSFLSEPPTKCAEKVSTVELPGGRNAAVDGLRMFGPLVTCNSTGSPVTFSVTATLIQSTLQPPTQAAQSRNRRLGRRWWKRRGVPGEFLSAQRARDLATSEGEC